MSASIEESLRCSKISVMSAEIMDENVSERALKERNSMTWEVKLDYLKSNAHSLN